MTMKPLTVAELRQRLLAFPGDSPVVFAWEGVIEPVQAHHVTQNPDDLLSSPRGIRPPTTVYLDAERGDQ